MGVPEFFYEFADPEAGVREPYALLKDWLESQKPKAWPSSCVTSTMIGEAV